MALNWLVELQPSENEQADDNQAYGDWFSHEGHDKTKVQWRERKTLGELILNRHVLSQKFRS